VSSIERINQDNLNCQFYKNLALECLKGASFKSLIDQQLLSNAKQSSQVFQDNPHFYLNPTEELRIGDIVKEGDKFLTVLGSGDFAIDAIYHGAKTVVTFDINKFQYPVAALKVKALSGLSYQDYFDFFCDIFSPSHLDETIYNQIKNKSLSDEIFYFWDILMEARKKDSNALRKNSLYSQYRNMALSYFMGLLDSDFAINKAVQDIDPNFDLLRIPNIIMSPSGVPAEGSYLENEHNYYKTQERIAHADIHHIHSNVTNLRDSLLSTGRFEQDCFQCIYLSNIPEYVDGKLFFSTVSNQLMPLLSENGVIVYCMQAMSTTLLQKTKSLKSPEVNGSLEYVHRMQEINNVQAYQLLQSSYNVSIDSVDTYSRENGNYDKDIFVYVKKK